MPADRDEHDVPRLVRRLQAQRERHAERSRVVRWLLVAVGFTILVAGLVMLITPGPAFVVIPVGLALLSLEFKWAESALEHSLVKAAKARQRAAETSRVQRILAAIATALGIAAVVAWAIWGDIPLAPV